MNMKEWMRRISRCMSKQRSLRRFEDWSLVSLSVRRGTTHLILKDSITFTLFSSVNIVSISTDTKKRFFGTLRSVASERLPETRSTEMTRSLFSKLMDIKTRLIVRTCATSQSCSSITRTWLTIQSLSCSTLDVNMTKMGITSSVTSPKKKTSQERLTLRTRRGTAIT